MTSRDTRVAPAQGWRPKRLADLAAAAAGRPLTRRSKPAPPRPALAVARARIGLNPRDTSSPLFGHDICACKQTQIAFKPVSRPAGGTLPAEGARCFRHLVCDFARNSREGGTLGVHASRAAQRVRPSRRVLRQSWRRWALGSPKAVSGTSACRARGKAQGAQPTSALSLGACEPTRTSFQQHPTTHPSRSLDPLFFRQDFKHVFGPMQQYRMTRIRARPPWRPRRTTRYPILHSDPSPHRYFVWTSTVCAGSNLPSARPEPSACLWRQDGLAGNLGELAYYHGHVPSPFATGLAQCGRPSGSRRVFAWLA